MRCIIIEDQPPAQRILKKYISDYDSLILVGTFQDAITGSEFLRANQVDLIFLDIHLPKLSGIDFLKNLNSSASVIMTTAFSDFALESYEFDVVDYLLKPFSFSRFLKAVSKVPVSSAPIKALTVDEKEKFVFIKSGYDHIKVKLGDILFIKSDSDYTEVYLASRKLLSPDSLKKWIELFPDNMLRVHKSYIINTDKIKKISSMSIDVGYTEEIPIGRAYKDTVNKQVLPRL